MQKRWPQIRIYSASKAIPKGQLKPVPVQAISTSFEHHFSSRRFQLLIHHKDAYSPFINASTTSTTTHLYKLPTGYPSKFIPIKFTNICKHYSLCWHVQTNAESLCGKQTLKENISIFKAHLKNLINQQGFTIGQTVTRIF